MSETVLILSIAYVFFSALLLLTLIYSGLHWLLKAFLLVSAILFYWLSYQGWNDSLGWPSNSQLPDNFLLHYGVIKEPDPEIGLPGSVFVWVSDINDRQLAPEPRAYQLDYNQALHGKLEEALKAVRDGKVQLGRLTTEDSPFNESFTASGGLRDDQTLTFYDLPDPALPEK